MVENNDVYLKLKITYENRIEEITLQELIPLEDIKNTIMEKFKIKENIKNSLVFAYYDNDGDLCQLEDDVDLFEISKEINDDLYVLELTLMLGESLAASKLLKSQRISKEIKEFNSHDQKDYNKSEIINIKNKEENNSQISKFRINNENDINNSSLESSNIINRPIINITKFKT
jgi:hypothetical protein